MTARQNPSLVAGPTCGLGDIDGESLAQALARRVAQVPEGRFWSLKQPDHAQSRTYGELWARSGRIAAGLLVRELPHGSPVVLMLGDSLDFIPAYWGCLRAGHVAVALSSLASEARIGRGSRALAAMLASVTPRLILADEELRGIAISEAASCPSMTLAEAESDSAMVEPVAPAELAYMLPTSGSSGSAKLVAISGRAVLYRAFTTRHAVARDAGAGINTFPIDSTTGIFSANLGTREAIHLPMTALARDPALLFRTIETHRASSFAITDTMAARIVEAAAESGRRWDLGSLRRVALGAETVRPSTVRRLEEALRRFGAPTGIIGAGYGTTETGTLLTGADPLASHLVGDLGVPLGTPMPNVGIRVVDGAGVIVPEGVVGEVEVHAPARMFSGYWGDPEATARGYTEDGWWRTGDTGLLFNEQLALKGRTKEIIIFNGRKHALGAIDEAMSQALGPGEAGYACTLPVHDGGSEALGVALLVSPERRAAAEAGVRDVVGRTFGLPIRAIRFVAPSAIPLTPTGKVNRLDLAALVSEAGAAISGPPIGDDTATSADFELWLRQRVARAISMPVAAVTTRTSISALGMDSLAILGLKGEITTRFGRDAPPSLAWQEASIAEIVTVFSGEDAPAATSGPPAHMADAERAASRRPESLPLSYGQEDMWRYARTPEGRRNPPETFRFSIRGPLRLDLLQETLNELVRRHEHLRTTFSETDGTRMQRIHPPSPAEVVFTDLSAQRRPAEKLEEVRRAAAMRVLDLETGPLLVAYVTRLSAEEHRFYLSLHHILFDARALVIIFSEIDQIYGALADGRTSPLRPVPLQMADFAREERRALDPSSTRFADEVRWWHDYWRRCDRCCTRFNFERAKPAHSVRTSDCTLVRRIPRILHDRLSAIVLDRGTSLFVAYCAAAAVTLARHSSGSGIVFGTYLSNRSALAGATIGCFLNLVQFHVAVDGAQTWAEVMQCTHDAVVAVAAHRSIPHQLLTKALGENRTPAPTLQAVFQYVPAAHAWTIPGLTIEREREIGRSSLHRYVSFSIVDSGGDPSVSLRLNGHYYSTIALEPLMRMFFENLEALADDAPLVTAKAPRPNLPSRILHAARTLPFIIGSRAGWYVADTYTQADDLRRELETIQSIAKDRVDLIQRLNGQIGILQPIVEERTESIQKLRSEFEEMQSVAEERAELIRRIHDEATMLRSVAEERSRLIEILHAEVERQRGELAALRA